MREIKFRAFDDRYKKMVMIDEILSRGNLLINGNGGLFLGTYRDNGDWVEFDLMQCTGLKDKNGVEIYEGDIVKMADQYSVSYDSFWVGKVVYDAPMFAVIVSKYGEELFLMPSIGTFDCTKQYEVIGNIYENPELLNGNA